MVTGDHAVGAVLLEVEAVHVGEDAAHALPGPAVVK